MSTRSRFHALALAASLALPGVVSPNLLSRWRDPVMGESLVSFRIAADGKAGGVDVQGLSEFERQ